jgi:hypothetical protein
MLVDVPLFVAVHEEREMLLLLADEEDLHMSYLV